MPDTPQPSFDPARFEGYFVELLDKLERIATVMERFDNVMNPTLDLAAAELAAQSADADSGSLFRHPLKGSVPSSAVPQVG